MRTIPEIHIVLLRSRLSEDKVADNKCHEVCRHLEGILKKIIYNITSKHCSNILVLVAYCLNGKLGNKDDIENMLKGFVTEKFGGKLRKLPDKCPKRNRFQRFPLLPPIHRNFNNMH
jgi:hypothetical protein